MDGFHRVHEAPQGSWGGGGGVAGAARKIIYGPCDNAGGAGKLNRVGSPWMYET